jgi:hypothetical protein
MGMWGGPLRHPSTAIAASKQTMQNGRRSLTLTSEGFSPDAFRPPAKQPRAIVSPSPFPNCCSALLLTTMVLLPLRIPQAHLQLVKQASCRHTMKAWTSDSLRGEWTTMLMNCREERVLTASTQAGHKEVLPWASWGQLCTEECHKNLNP